MSDFNESYNPEPLAFCQNCGSALNSETVRRVGPAVYCEPCLVDRLAGHPPSPGSQSGSQPGSVPPPSADPNWRYAAPVPPTWTSANQPNPGLAALLGLIPGVGAMYNEQYAKGLVHLLIFAVLESFSHVVGIFHLFALGWICYMSIEAHHTAKARRDGTPLPNPFGLNDIAERSGFGKAWPHADVAGAARDAVNAAAAGIGAAAAGFNRPNPQQPAPPQTPPAAYSNWGAPVNTYPPTADPMADPAYAAAWKQHAAQTAEIPYQQPYTYTHPNPTPPYAETFVPPASPIPPAAPQPGRFPAGAVWLIGLGMVFLLGTLGIFSAVPGSAIVGVTLLVLGVWIFLRRMLETGSTLEYDGTPGYHLRLLRALRVSVWLVVIGIISLLDSFRLVHWDNQWPWLIILAGVMMLLQRTAYNSAAGAAYTPPTAPTPPETSERGL
jgi:hypothetical protein